MSLYSQIGICNDCECNGNFDVNLGSSCDNVTGFCMGCTNNTFGAECENCIDGYYGDPISGEPCIRKLYNMLLTIIEWL